MSPDPRPDAPAGRRLTTLGALLRATRDELRDAEPPPALREAVRARAAAAREAAAPQPLRPALATPAPSPSSAGAIGHPPRSSDGGRPSASVLAIAAGLLLLAGWAAWWLVVRAPVGPAGLPMSHQAALGTAFVPVGADDQLPRVAQAGGLAWLVRTELPRERLALLGLPFDPARAGERVPAELLLNPNGEVLAVRIVP